MGGMAAGGDWAVAGSQEVEGAPTVGGVAGVTGGYTILPVGCPGDSTKR